MNELPHGAKPNSPLLPDEILVLPFVPEGGGWATEAQVVAILAEQGLTVAEPRTMLNRLRRRGWLVCNKHADPPVWTRTPSGSAAVEQILTFA